MPASASPLSSLTPWRSSQKMPPVLLLLLTAVVTDVMTLKYANALNKECLNIVLTDTYVVISCGPSSTLSILHK